MLTIIKFQDPALKHGEAKELLKQKLGFLFFFLILNIEVLNKWKQDFRLGCMS